MINDEIYRKRIYTCCIFQCFESVHDGLNRGVLLVGVVRVVRNVDKKEIPPSQPLSQIQWTESENYILIFRTGNVRDSSLFNRMPL